MFELLYVCQLAEPGAHDLSVYAGLADGADDAEWFMARLKALGLADAVTVTTRRVCLGERLPPPVGYQAAIIGGSYHMVAEDRPWQRQILAWLQGARDRSVPVLGICGGHQLLGQLHGAAVRPLAEGTWSTTIAPELSAAGARHWLFEGLAGAPFHFANSEHVATLSDTMTVLAFLPTSPALAVDYGGGWVGVQFHPEMTSEACARSWQGLDPARAKHYRAAPRSPRLLQNFLRHAGL